MELLDLSKLVPDPLTKAIAEASCKTVTVSGYVRSAEKDTISICENQTGRSYVEYQRSSVIAAFKDDDESTKVTLLIKGDAEIRVIRHDRASGGGVKGCGCSDTPGVLEARPLASIHPALAELAALVKEVKAGLGASYELRCEEARADCYRNGKSADECESAAAVCRFLGGFGSSPPSWYKPNLW